MSKPSANERWWERYLPSAVTKYLPQTVPGDVQVVAGFLLVANLLLVALPDGAVLVRSVIGFPLLFFVPGYVLVAVLFPGQRSSRLQSDTLVETVSQSRTSGLTWRERLALSFGTSIAILPPLALVLSLAGLEYTITTIVAALTVFTAFGLVLAVVYRNREPPVDRFEVPVTQWVSAARGAVFGQKNSVDAAVNVIVVLVVVVSMVGVGYALVVPNNAESFTSVSLLTEDENGELVTAGYPETIDGSGANLTLELESNERRTTDYTVVAELQRVETAETSTTVLQREEVLRTNETIDPGASWRTNHTIEPALAGENLRLIYYVYTDDVPEEPSTETAYRHVNVWVDVPISAAQ